MLLSCDYWITGLDYWTALSMLSSSISRILVVWMQVGLGPHHADVHVLVMATVYTLVMPSVHYVQSK